LPQWQSRAGCQIARAVDNFCSDHRVHGNADATVAPAKGLRIITDSMPTGRQTIEIVENIMIAERGIHRITHVGLDGKLRAKYWAIDGSGHAWSGGNPKGSYVDAQGPDASDEMVRSFVSLKG
jgi:poly(3-hydroxybutyrate) depolymerase